MKKILIVDDDQATRSVIRTILEFETRQKFEILEAENGTECLMLAENEGPVDLILLDITMPDLDGFAVCRAIRKVDPDVPIIFVTASAEIGDRVSSRKAGGDSYLVKPVQHAKLMALVNLLTSDTHHHSDG